jgi:hypothetical protein
MKIDSDHVDKLLVRCIEYLHGLACGYLIKMVELRRCVAVSCEKQSRVSDHWQLIGLTIIGNY